LIRKLERYKDTVPNQQAPAVKARFDLSIDDVLKSVAEHFLILAMRLVIRQLHEEFKMLRRHGILSRGKRPPDLAILGREKALSGNMIVGSRLAQRVTA
jgi:hypothetical protein